MSNSNWSASAVQPPPTHPAPAKPPGISTSEAVTVLRVGGKVQHRDWEAWEWMELDGYERFRFCDGRFVHVQAKTADQVDAPVWYVFDEPKPAPAQTIEDVPPRLTTVEFLQALVAGKRVRQTHPQRGSVWHLRDGYFRSDSGHCCDTISISATDLIQSRYTIEP